MNWDIYCHLKSTSPSIATATFVHDGKEIGSVDVDAVKHARADYAFIELIKQPTKWENLPTELHRAMLVYRQETLADVKHHSKTYRFVNTSVPIGTRWKLTTEKLNLRETNYAQLPLAL